MASRGRAPLARFLFSPSAPAVVPSVVSPASPGLCNDSTNVELPQVTTRTNTPLVVTSPLSTTDANSQPRPNEDIMDEDANVGVEEAEIVSTPTPNGSSAVGNSCHNVEKIFVGVDGNNVYDFKPWDEAHLKMSEIVRSYYTGAWSSITKVPLATKDMWFEEFKKLFYWNITNHQMRKVFMHQAGLHIRSVFKSCRKRKTRPNFVSKQKWEEIETFRKTDPGMVKQSATNKRNKSTPNAINSGNYRGGRRKLSTWKDILEKRDGKKRRISDLVRQFWTKEDGTWTGSNPAAYVEKFESLVVTQDDEIDSGEVMTDLEEKRLWLTACGGPKNKKIFALGEQGAALIRSGTFSTSPSQSHHSPEFQEAFVQPFKDEIQELKATVVNLLKQHEEQQQKQAEFQLLILQQLTRLQGNSN